MNEKNSLCVSVVESKYGDFHKLMLMLLVAVTGLGKG